MSPVQRGWRILHFIHEEERAAFFESRAGFLSRAMHRIVFFFHRASLGGTAALTPLGIRGLLCFASGLRGSFQVFFFFQFVTHCLFAKCVCQALKEPSAEYTYCEHPHLATPQSQNGVTKCEEIGRRYWHWTEAEVRKAIGWHKNHARPKCSTVIHRIMFVLCQLFFNFEAFY